MSKGEVIVRYENGIAISIPVKAANVERCLEEALSLLTGRPPKKPEYNWEFDTLEKHAKKQQKESQEIKEETKAIAKEIAKREINKQLREAAEILKQNIRVHGEISAEFAEVATEAMERNTYVKGDSIYTFERKILRELLNENMDKCIGD
ncbi:hypothetical protein MKX72_20125 [Priestia sp. FSL R5-0597]|uniref:hypothetical protein n=1 Tax=Priestia sp. FSL R5-0597 TaxID=2921580 RepID=UPI0030F7E1B2